MKSDSNREFRKRSRDFKGKLKLTENTPLKKLEKIFVELYDFGINSYLEAEKEREPEKSTKEIIVEMYNLRDKLKSRSLK